MDPERLRELLSSPLDEPKAQRGRRRWVVGAVAVVAVIVGGSVVLAFRGDGRTGWFGFEPGGNSTSSAPTAVAGGSSTTSTVPGIPGYPSASWFHQLVYDPGTDRVILTNGSALHPTNVGRPGPTLEETWGYDAASETWYAYPDAPPPRVGYAMAGDEVSGQMVLFGGSAGSFRQCGVQGPCTTGALGETWLLDPATGEWSEAAPVESPAPRYGAAMAYDAQSGTLVLFGGAAMPPRSARNDFLDDLWTFDVATTTWTELTPANAPPGRAWHRMVYDPDGDRILMFGGSSGGELDGRVWSYDADANRWAVSETVGPEGRWTPIVAFDTQSRLLVVVGGQGPTVRTIGEGVTATELRWRGDVWTYSPAADAWTEHPSLEGVVPWASGAYHPGTDRVVAQFFDVTGLLDADAGQWEWVEAREAGGS